MRTFVSVLVLALTLGVCSCGNNDKKQQQASATGNWAATLANSDSSAQTMSFDFTMSQNGMMMGMSNLNVTNASACFGSGSIMTGQMMNFSGSMGMQMQMTIEMWSGPNATGNHLVMQMGMPNGNSNQMTGTYAITGITSGCASQTGTVTMMRMTASTN